MGADIFESFVGSIIAAMIIASNSDDMSADYVIMPIMLGLIGYVASIIGVFSMTFLKNGSDPAAAFKKYNIHSCGLILDWWLSIYHSRFDGCKPGVMHSVVLGSIVGIMIGLVTEYYTGIEPVFGIKNKSNSSYRRNVKNRPCNQRYCGPLSRNDVNILTDYFDFYRNSKVQMSSMVAVKWDSMELLWLQWEC